MKFAVYTLYLFISLGLADLQVEKFGAIGNFQSSERTLILYLSRTNNTKTVAEMIQKEVGGDLVAVELENPYPEDYDAIVKQVAEENASGFLPLLKTKVDIGQYDTIFFGFPTWGMQLPPPMKSFLNEYDLKDKTIIPFNTNAGYGLGSSLSTLKELSPNSSILNELSVEGGVERDGIYFVMEGKREVEVREAVQKWLKQINVLHQ
ncbi:flavodoxin [uncultured Kriegella sp.]|uniref:flavodoxin n=1 Tax=uncultured Kriegella sp. TaxID=1798910 RepID=UPI0030DCA2A0|tara:strand:+ start:2925 stop:3542 length:618 start_codon:yes stop_codon:yes gene_type:complete